MQEMAALFDNEAIASAKPSTLHNELNQYTNTAPTTFQLAGSIVARALVAYNIPLSASFLVQLNFFLGNLNNSGLTIEVYSRGPRVYITGAVGDITLNASWLRLDVEYYSSAAVDAKLAEQKSKVHTWKFLNTAHHTQSLAMTANNIYPIQLVSSTSTQKKSTRS